jgi:hypothetical protein
MPTTMTLAVLMAGLSLFTCSTGNGLTLHKNVRDSWALWDTVESRWVHKLCRNIDPVLLPDITHDKRQPIQTHLVAL